MKVRFFKDGARPLAGVEPLARRGVGLVMARHRVRARGELNVLWTTREKIRRLNRRFRATDRVTDVIAFRYQDAGEKNRAFRMPSAGPWATFGDLHIAVAQARLNAARFKVPFREELVRLAVHGALHLLGYTDYVPREKKKMWAVQESVLGHIFSRARNGAK